MSDPTQPSIPYEELKQYVLEPATLNAKVVGHKKRHPDAIRRQTREELKISRGGSSPDLLIAPEAVQAMIDTGRIALRDEPAPTDAPTRPFGYRTPSPDAFLARHGLTRPGKALKDNAE